MSMVDLGPMDEDVAFDHGNASRFALVCRNAASELDAQGSGRSGWEDAALADFHGHFADVFSSNASVRASDASSLIDALILVANGVDKVAGEARKEQDRRDTARDWASRHDDWWEQAWDSVFGQDDPPEAAGATPVSIAIAAPDSHSRDTPQPGSGQGSSAGYTSAKPEDLRSYATNSGQADDTLCHHRSSVGGAYDTFRDTCTWGGVNADGVVGAFTKYIEANRNDGRWARTVADAFARAGGEGAVSTLPDAAIEAALGSANVGVSREPLSIENPGMYGMQTTTGYADDPVNTATGLFIEPERDLAFAGGCASLTLSRTYNSADKASRAFGVGWCSILDSRLTFTSQGAVWLREDGRQVRFPREGSLWSRSEGDSYWLSDMQDGYGLADNRGGRWMFSHAGELEGFGTSAHEWISCVRDGDGLVVGLRHRRGASIRLTWQGSRVGLAETRAGVSDDAMPGGGASVGYGYDDAGRLVRVVADGGATIYGYGDNGLIESVTDADGVRRVANTYDAGGRILAQTSPFGRDSHYTYLAGGVSVVADRDGGRANTWMSDARGRCVGVVDSDGNRQSMSYDQWGCPVMLTERDGAATLREYDDRGRLVREVTPQGADLRWGWDGSDRLTTLIGEHGAVTLFDYEGQERNPSRVTDPCGGVTGLEWSGGLLRRVTGPTGVGIALEYDGRGNLTAMRDGAGRTAQWEHDALGRPTAAITPSGHRTEFRYDSAGNMIAVRLADGAVWRYSYSPAGRLLETTAPDGATARMAYGAHGCETESIDALGRRIVSHYDDLGNLCGADLPGGARWRFTHDALSRLVGITAPDGGVWRNAYNANGMLERTEDPTGVGRHAHVDRARREMTLGDGLMRRSASFDPLGRLTREGDGQGSDSMIVYDRCGRPVEILDPAGALTLLRRDAAGRVVERVSPTGLTTTFAYDECGHLAARVEPGGARTTFAYDSDGHLCSQTLPSGDVARAEYDACGRMTMLERPGRGRSTWRYDRCGRLASSYDTWHGRRSYTYDAAGQLTAVGNALGGLTRYGYDGAGRLTSITDPMGHVTRREWDAVGRCVSATDPLGRSTSAGYDLAGRQVWQEDPDGTRLTFSYDHTGRLSGVRAVGPGGETGVTTYERDFTTRTLGVRRRRGDGALDVSRLGWDARGLLVSDTRTEGRDTGGQAWRYDLEGRRVSMTFPDGGTATYTYDPVTGRLSGVAHPGAGEASFEYDDAGRLSAATAGGLLQTWRHENNWPVGHTVTDGDGSTATLIRRDAEGRILQVERDGLATAYEYDLAGQLTGSRTTGLDGATHETAWRYDADGRIESIRRDGEVTRCDYDAAGQLVRVSGPGGTGGFSYDAAGRRVGERHPDGSTRAFEWDAGGFLDSVTTTSPDGASARLTCLTDALGRVRSIGGTGLFWDQASPVPSPSFVGGRPVGMLGPLTAIGGAWRTPGWRAGRTTGQADPWQAGQTGADGSGANGSAAPKTTVSLGVDGALSFAGLEWMGARVYDPATRGFLTTDPLEAPAGAAWAANPYEYAGNNPLSMLDPTGLKPVTDPAILAQFGQEHTTWLGENWEYVAGGAMVVAGGALMATGVGGPVGMMLVSAGADTIFQKATTGDVDWRVVAVFGALGAVGGGAVWSGVSLGAGFSVASQMFLTGQVDWAQVNRDAAVGGVTGGVGQGLAAPLAAGTKALNIPGLKTAGGLVGQAGKVLSGTGARATVSSGVASAAGNTLDYALDGDVRHTADGYAQSAGIGMLTGAGGSAAGSGIGRLLGKGLGGVGVSTAKHVGHHVKSTYSLGGEVAEITVNHASGAASGYVNELWRPTDHSGDSDKKQQDSWWAAGQGFVTGGVGPSAGLHEAG